MEIEISARAVFAFKPTLTLLQSLETCAILHYDATCKAAAAPGGLIQREIQLFGFTGPESASISWSFRELDLILKICENPPRALEANAIAQLSEFVLASHKALSRANELQLQWHEVITYPDPVVNLDQSHENL